MASAADRLARYAVPIVAAACGAAAFLLGTGTHPHAWAAWLAPLPVLLLAPRVPGWVAGAGACGAHLVGSAGVLHYYVGTLGQPVAIGAALVVVTSGVFTLAVLLLRALLRAGLPLLAAGGCAATWAAGQYLIGTLTPLGSNDSLATGQFAVRPVIQVVSLTGVWGVDFLVVAASAALTAATYRVRHGTGGAGRVRVAVAAAVLGAAVLGYGAVRMSRHAPRSVRVTVAAATVTGMAPGDPVDAGAVTGRRLLRADLALVGRAADSAVVVFPEKDFATDAASLPALTGAFRRAARLTGTAIVVGAVTHVRGARYNTALAFPPDGRPPVAYHKRYPVPGVEDAFTAGDSAGYLPGTPVRTGVAICADLGRPAVGRDYGRTGTALLVAPALDFGVDAWSQSRVQSLRGIENGYPVARASRDGYLTVTGPTGRLLGQLPVPAAPSAGGAPADASLTVPVPVGTGPTVYGRVGDAFGYACLLLAAASAVTWWIRRRDTAARRTSVPHSVPAA